MLYVARRLVFVSVAFFSSISTYQRVACQLMNLLMLLYIGTGPFVGKAMQRMEMINEWVVVMCAWNMMFFTEWVADYEV